MTIYYWDKSSDLEKSHLTQMCQPASIFYLLASSIAHVYKDPWGRSISCNNSIYLLLSTPYHFNIYVPLLTFLQYTTKFLTFISFISFLRTSELSALDYKLLHGHLIHFHLTTSSRWYAAREKKGRPCCCQRQLPDGLDMQLPFTKLQRMTLWPWANSSLNRHWSVSVMVCHLSQNLEEDLWTTLLLE